MPSRETLRRSILGRALSLCVLSAEAWAAPDDVPGWEETRWGMTRAQLDAALGGQAEALSGRWLYGGAYAELTVREVVVGGLTFAAFLQMDNNSDRLRQVLLERRRVGATPAAFEQLLDSLERTYGTPSVVCAQDKTGGQPLDYQLIWRFPSTTIHVKFLDFSTTAVFRLDPQADVDPLVNKRDIRRNITRFMPRRILLRYHDARERTLDRGCW